MDLVEILFQALDSQERDMFTYKSPIGLMKIYYDQKLDGYALVINEKHYGVYDSAVAAADDVYTQNTGCCSWDDNEFKDILTNIYEWEQIK